MKVWTTFRDRLFSRGWHVWLQIKISIRSWGSGSNEEDNLHTRSFNPNYGNKSDSEWNDEERGFTSWSERWTKRKAVRLTAEEWMSCASLLLSKTLSLTRMAQISRKSDWRLNNFWNKKEISHIYVNFSVWFDPAFYAEFWMTGLTYWRSWKLSC